MGNASRYELLDRIAIGGMAELFRARIVGEQGFSKVVAIKRILPQFAGDEQFVRMLIDEARTASSLSHPNIAGVHELRRDAEGGLFIALEYVSGPSLAGLLGKLSEAGRRLPEACALDIGIHLLEALDHAHRTTDASGKPLGVVHRDVSPDNVLITCEGTVKLTDFGVAKARGRMTQTQQGMIKGKLAYMSPEQVRGLAVDARSDQFSAALLLFEALTGKAHYDAPGDYDLMKQVAAGKARPLSECGVKVAKEIQAALDKALAAEPEKRFERCGDFARALATYHRKTWPAYAQSELGALVLEFYRERFELLAARLRCFEEGAEKPLGMIELGGAEATPAALAAAGEIAATDTRRRALAEGRAEARPRRVSRDALPVEPGRKRSRPEVPRSRAKAPVDSPSPAAPAEPAPEDRKAQDAAVEQVLAEARREEKKQVAPGARKALTAVLSVAAFVVAIGAGLGAMSWLRGSSLLEEEPISLPQPATPLARPPEEPAAEPKEDPKEPKERPARPAPRPPKDGAPQRAPTGAPKKPEPTPTAAVAPAEPAPTGKGILDIECIPDGCEVELDGGRAVPAPLTREVAAGSHKVRLVHQAIGVRRELSVDVAAGTTTTRTINLVTGR